MVSVALESRQGPLTKELRNLGDEHTLNSDLLFALQIVRDRSFLCTLDVI
jgi:hypothetical protein